eukprot:1150143-Pelagomonas_calceolata.AAC.6
MTLSSSIILIILIIIQDGVVDFTPRRFRKTFRIHICNWLSISVPCRPDERMQLNCKVVVMSKGFGTISPRYAWIQSNLSSSGKVETFVTEHTQIFKDI